MNGTVSFPSTSPFIATVHPRPRAPLRETEEKRLFGVSKAKLSSSSSSSLFLKVMNPFCGLAVCVVVYLWRSCQSP